MQECPTRSAASENVKPNVLPSKNSWLLQMSEMHVQTNLDTSQPNSAQSSSLFHNKALQTRRRWKGCHFEKIVAIQMLQGEFMSTVLNPF